MLNAAQRRTCARLAAALVVVFAAGAVPARAEGLYSNADYWDFADRRQADAEPLWLERQGRYRIAAGNEDVRLNANMLAVHALAALGGHDGPARRDERIAPLVARLTSSPAYVDSEAQLVDHGPDGHQHAPGWTPSSLVAGGDQHIAIDPKVAEALAYAWRAREIVALDRALSARIVQEIRDVARPVLPLRAAQPVQLEQRHLHLGRPGERR